MAMASTPLSHESATMPTETPVMLSRIDTEAVGALAQKYSSGHPDLLAALNQLWQFVLLNGAMHHVWVEMKADTKTKTSPASPASPPPALLTVRTYDLDVAAPVMLQVSPQKICREAKVITCGEDLPRFVFCQANPRGESDQASNPAEAGFEECPSSSSPASVTASATAMVISPVPPVEAPANPTWQCQWCTVLNEAAKVRCQVCFRISPLALLGKVGPRCVSGWVERGVGRGKQLVDNLLGGPGALVPSTSSQNANLLSAQLTPPSAPPVTVAPPSTTPTTTASEALPPLPRISSVVTISDSPDSDTATSAATTSSEVADEVVVVSSAPASPGPPPNAEPEPPTCANIGKYKMIRKIGHGAYGVVYEVADALGQRLAMKQIPLQPSAVELFQAQSFLLQEIHHPNIIPYLDMFTHCEPASALTVGVVVMPYYQADLTSLVRSSTRVEERQATRIAVQVASALCHLHSLQPRHVTHGDVKPENLLWDDTTQRVVLADLEAVRLESEAPCGGGGTYAYQSPEQVLEKSVTPKADIWGLGCVLFLLATQPEFPAVLHDELRQRGGELPFLQWVRDTMASRSYSDTFVSCVGGCLRHRVESRYSARELIDLLCNCATVDHRQCSVC